MMPPWTIEDPIPGTWAAEWQRIEADLRRAGGPIVGRFLVWRWRRRWRRVFAEWIY